MLGEQLTRLRKRSHAVLHRKLVETINFKEHYDNGNDN